jgi:uncharacterized membrane protein YfcA
MPDAPLALVLICFAAFFTFGMTGFGSALIAMPLLVPMLGVKVAAPLVALCGVSAEVVLIWRYRKQIQLGNVWRLALASGLAIPVGLLAARLLDQRLVMLALGMVVTFYGVYGLLNLPLPHLQHPNWAFPFGLLSGVLSGAYNTGGPPAVIYGTMSRWSSNEFKTNLQGMFLVNSSIVLASHTLSGNITGSVLTDYLIAMPGVLLGIWLGMRIEKHVPPLLFRRIVLVLLVLIGARLLLST